MKKIVVMLLLLVSVLSLTVGAFAQQFYVYDNPNDSDETIKIPVDQSHVIGTIRFCVEEAQRLPAEIDGAICDGDDDAYNSKMAELASCIAQANSAMADTKMPTGRGKSSIASVSGSVRSNSITAHMAIRKL